MRGGRVKKKNKKALCIFPRDREKKKKETVRRNDPRVKTCKGGGGSYSNASLGEERQNDPGSDGLLTVKKRKRTFGKKKKRERV